jgi:hypothetical protein
MTYEAQVAAALDALALRPPDAFLWFGRRETVDGADDSLVERIARRLYEDFYGAAVPLARRASPAVASDDDGGAFVRALSQANGGRGAWQDGWRVAAPESGDGVTVVRPGGLALLAPAEQVRAAGDRAAVLQPKELRGASPGYYVALGDHAFDPDDDLAGLHWNIAAAGAATLVARLTYACNGAGLAFRLELRDAPGRYGRGDAAVLAIARRDYAPEMKLLRPLLRALGPHLAGGAPAFTKPLARGLALAELPAGGQRFGEQRCRLLAEAMVAAGAGGARSPEARLAVVREHFAAAGVSLDAPYLQAGSADAYVS